jgi:hypothetical protein
MLYAFLVSSMHVTCPAHRGYDHRNNIS